MFYLQLLSSGVLFVCFLHKLYRNCMQRSFWIHYTYAVSVLEENYLLPCSVVYVWFTLTSLHQFLLIIIFF